MIRPADIGGAPFRPLYQRLIPRLSCPVDGPGLVALPSRYQHWRALGLPIPDFWFRCQETSGNLTDEIQGATLTAASSNAYAQAVTGWTATALGPDSETSTEGFGAVSGSLFNIATQNVTVLAYALATTVSGARVFIPLSSGNRYIGFQGSNGFLQVVGGGTVTGAVNHKDSVIHPFLVKWINGTGVLGHSGAGQWSVATDKERLVGTWGITADAVKGLAGAGFAATPPVCKFLMYAAWIGDNSDALTVLGDKNVLQRMRWAVSGY